jgi:hypothetical protein
MPKPLPRKARDEFPPARRGGGAAAAASRAARARLLRRAALHVALATVLVGGVGWLVGYLRTAVAETAAAALPDPPRVVFANRPAWMSDFLAAELAEVCRPNGNPSVFDRDALVRINGRLNANPWIAKVRQVRRVYAQAAGDTIEVDCDFRAPLGLVRGGRDEAGRDVYWFVDAKGVRLPERFTAADVPKVVYAADGKVNVRVIEGVRNAPPAKAGQPWPGDDLAAGLELAEKLNGQPFAEEIERIDVSNYAGRVEKREAYLVLRTRQHTEVRWGRPWGAADWFVEIKPEVKLDTLRRMVARYGRVDAGQQWLDIRFERISTPPVATTQDVGR